MAPNQETLKSDLFQLLKLSALGPDGSMLPDAAHDDRAYALQVVSQTRMIFSEAWEKSKTSTNASNSGGPTSSNTNIEDREIDPETFAGLVRQFEDWYGFTLDASQRGNDRLLEQLRQQASQGCLKTLNLKTVYSATDQGAQWPSNGGKAGKGGKGGKGKGLAFNPVSDHDECSRRLDIALNSYALVGMQQTDRGHPFCDLQATLDYKTFFERRLQAVGRYLPAAAVMEADFNHRAHITELVNSKKCNSQSEAIHQSWGLVWNVGNPRA